MLVMESFAVGGVALCGCGCGKLVMSLDNRDMLNQIVLSQDGRPSGRIPSARYPFKPRVPGILNTPELFVFQAVDLDIIDLVKLKLKIQRPIMSELYADGVPS
jgi:hypothetical protein